MIFVVEDDRSIRELECYALGQAGFETQGFEDGAAFWKAVGATLPQLVVLDVMLPGEDGNCILARLRKDERTRTVPVVMVTARGEEMDKVQSLDGGADDYLVKPFGVMEFLSRIKAVLRRAQAAAPAETAKLVCGSIRMDVERHKVFVGDAGVVLTHMEFELLRYLMLNQGIAMTRERLLDTVWGLAYAGDTRTVDVHMRTLRVKLGEAGALLQTVRGVGYRLEANDAETNF